MGLPRVQTEIREVNQLQTNISQLVDPIAANPLINGIILKNVVLTNGTNRVNHLLGRPLVGWFVVGINNSITSLYDAQATNPSPAQTLILIINGNATVNLYVF